MQKQENFELMKSGEGDGGFYRVKSPTVDVKSTPFDRSPIKDGRAFQALGQGR